MRVALPAKGMRLGQAVLAALLLLLAAPALAAGGGEEHESLLDLLYPAINLVILLAVLFYFARKPVQAFFEERRSVLRGTP